MQNGGGCFSLVDGNTTFALLYTFKTKRNSHLNRVIMSSDLSGLHRATFHGVGTYPAEGCPLVPAAGVGPRSSSSAEALLLGCVVRAGPHAGQDDLPIFVWRVWPSSFRRSACLASGVKQTRWTVRALPLLCYENSGSNVVAGMG